MVSAALCYFSGVTKFNVRAVWKTDRWRDWKSRHAILARIADGDFFRARGVK